MNENQVVRPSVATPGVSAGLRRSPGKYFDSPIGPVEAVEVSSRSGGSDTWRCVGAEASPQLREPRAAGPSVRVAIVVQPVPPAHNASAPTIQHRLIMANPSA